MSQAIEGNKTRDSTYRDSGDFDKLISALRTADVFEDHPKKRIHRVGKPFDISRERGKEDCLSELDNP